MSEQTDLIMSRVTSEWQTKREIAGHPYPHTMYQLAGKVLNRMLEDGLVERRYSTSGHARTYWRLRP